MNEKYEVLWKDWREVLLSEDDVVKSEDKIEGKERNPRLL